MRGAHMDDVIFAGTRERKPTGMAEVTLHLVDPEVYEGRSTRARHRNSGRDARTTGMSPPCAPTREEVEEYTEEVRPGQTDE